MIVKIRRSQKADTRSCDFSNVSKEELRDASIMHINDVRNGMASLAIKLQESARLHDHDKLSNIDQFHADFLTGFKQTGWWDNHRLVNRHHINAPDGVREDVNLIDVLEHIVDCVMAGKARTGSVYPLSLPPELLERAFQNTVDLVASEVVVVEEEQKESGNEQG